RDLRQPRLRSTCPADFCNRYGTTPIPRDRTQPCKLPLTVTHARTFWGSREILSVWTFIITCSGAYDRTSFGDWVTSSPLRKRRETLAFRSFLPPARHDLGG